MKYNKSQRANLTHLALNRFDNDIPREMWVTEGPDFLSKKPKLHPYDVNIYEAIEYAIQEGVINITDTIGELNVQVDWEEVDTELDSYILNKPEIIDDDTFDSATDTNLATSESIKAYVDAQISTIAVNSTETVIVGSNSSTTIVPIDNRFYRIQEAGGGQNDVTNVLTIDNSNLAEGITFYIGYDGLSGDTSNTLVTLTDGSVEPINLVIDGTSNFTIRRGEVVKLVSSNGSPNLITTSVSRSLLDDDTFATANNSQGATAESIKAYVDNQVATAGTTASYLTTTLAGVTFSLEYHGVVPAITNTSAGTYSLDFSACTVYWMNVVGNNDVASLTNPGGELILNITNSNPRDYSMTVKNLTNKQTHDRFATGAVVNDLQNIVGNVNGMTISGLSVFGTTGYKLRIT